MMLLLLVAIAAADAPARGIPWQRDHGAAATAAEEKGAPLLIHFRSADCSTGREEYSVRDAVSDCDAMEETVWSNASVVEAAARFVPVLTGDTADRVLTRRYEAATMPTTLIADPWGNEIVRLVRYVDAVRVLRVLNGIPRDFAPLAAIGPALRKNPQSADLLLKAAGYYETVRLPEFAERYYERATDTPGFRADPALRRRLAVARGTGLLRLGKSAAAAKIFRDAFEETADGEQGDTVLFGWMMAELQQGRTKEAARPYRELLARFPDSKYTPKARENFAAANKN